MIRAVKDYRKIIHWLSIGLFVVAASPAHADDFTLPEGLQTVSDGRQPVQVLYDAYLGLLQRGWLLEIIHRSQPVGLPFALPIIALRSPQPGPAVWILSGIHGEEPAGPNAIAMVIDDIASLGEKRPVVLLPLSNPHGYVRNWRYLNVATWSADVDGHSVGDASHWLPDPDRPEQPRASRPSSPEAAAITAYILRQAATYPPSHSIDLHEDSLISEGYVYSQGTLGSADPLAKLAVRVLQQNGIPLKLAGETRFGEAITDGIIGPVEDSSLDELMSAAVVIENGLQQPGPGTDTVLVFETPAGSLGLQRRISAHADLLRALVHELAGGKPD